MRVKWSARSCGRPTPVWRSRSRPACSGDAPSAAGGPGARSGARPVRASRLNWSAPWMWRLWRHRSASVTSLGSRWRDSRARGHRRRPRGDGGPFGHDPHGSGCRPTRTTCRVARHRAGRPRTARTNASRDAALREVLGPEPQRVEELDSRATVDGRRLGAGGGSEDRPRPRLGLMGTELEVGRRQGRPRSGRGPRRDQGRPEPPHAALDVGVRLPVAIGQQLHDPASERDRRRSPAGDPRSPCVPAFDALEPDGGQPELGDGQTFFEAFHQPHRARHSRAPRAGSARRSRVAASRPWARGTSSCGPACR